MILVDALYINRGGGKVLLKYLIGNLPKVDKNIFFLFDNRLESEFSQLNLNCLFLNASLITRHAFYRKHKNNFSIVFTFANLPPTIRLNCTVITFFQNILLVDKGFITISLQLKRIIFKLLTPNTNKWIVQSNYVKEELGKNISKKSEILVLPFYEEFSIPNILAKRNLIDKEKINFIFISSGEIHKNHLRLLNAFIEVNKRYPKFTLTLTIGSEYPSLLTLINKLIVNRVNIINIGNVSKEKLKLEYAKADVCIYPSLKESFGLGLIEAAQFGLPILASDLPYVREVVKPSFYFNPLEVNSIASAMLNYRKYTNKKVEIIAKNNINSIYSLLGLVC